jgi:dynactin complex subunit
MCHSLLKENRNVVSSRIIFLRSNNHFVVVVVVFKVVSSSPKTNKKSYNGLSEKATITIQQYLINATFISWWLQEYVLSPAIFSSKKSSFDDLKLSEDDKNH